MREGESVGERFGANKLEDFSEGEAGKKLDQQGGNRRGVALQPWNDCLDSGDELRDERRGIGI